MTAQVFRALWGYVERPDKTPWAGKTVTARLTVVDFIDDGTASPSLTTELIREAYAVSDATGLYKFTGLPILTDITIRVNGDATILAVNIPAGSGNAWIGDVLAVDPVNPGPFVIGVSEVAFEAYQALVSTTYVRLPVAPPTRIGQTLIVTQLGAVPVLSWSPNPLPLFPATGLYPSPTLYPKAA